MYYNISKRFNIARPVTLIFSIILLSRGTAQETAYSPPPVTSNWDNYREQVLADSTKRMVELKDLVPGIIYDLRYATANNFMNRVMYSGNNHTTFLRLPAVRGLEKIQAVLNQKGLGLKIFDAYRPYSVTVKFWELVKDENYVAHPAKGSGHNRGIAVDLTLINLGSGQELDMGTGFDNFSDTAHHSFRQLPPAILQNRLLLKSTMEDHGFKSYEKEWWHYFIPGGGQYEILDIDFRKLKMDL